jgi:proline iminopeptidase
MVDTSKRIGLFEPFEPIETGMLKVSEIHSIYWEVSGNPEGKPVIILHGGPGGGSSPSYRRYFDKTAYRIVQFDQRGAGKSTPAACLEENTTQHSIADIEKLREMLKIEKWHTVFGGSWGSTLSLAYAEAHPERVGHLVLRGIFLLRKSEIDFFYQEGSSWVFPEFHEEFRNLLPPVERGNILHNYYRRLTGTNEEEKIKFARAWTKWEMSTSHLFIDQDSINRTENDLFITQFARIETHYFVHGGFFEKDGQLLEDAHKIENIPTVIVQGRYDMVCPAKSAYDMSQRLKKCELHMIPDAGHSAAEPGIIDGLVRATEKFKNED